MTPSRLPQPARRVVAALLAAWVVVLALTLLGPSAEGPSWLVATVSAVAERLGLPAVVTAPERVEFALNAAAFVPVSLLGSLLWPRWTWRDWTAGGFVASFSVEAVQALFLSARSATYVDVVSNTLGGLGGAVLALVVAALLARTSEADGGASEGSGSEGGADLAHGSSAAQQDELPG